MKTIKTFYGIEGYPDTEAIEWLLHLSKCFLVKSIKMSLSKLERKYRIDYKVRVEVKYVR